jgi:hypothetical protein
MQLDTLRASGTGHRKLLFYPQFWFYVLVEFLGRPDFIWVNAIAQFSAADGSVSPFGKALVEFDQLPM